ncbi:MAG: hypothetical protein U0R50_13200 [Gaiellales bacterium]
MSAGYSGTPLPKKLGIGEGSAVAILGDPGHAAKLLEPLPPGVRFVRTAKQADVVLFFTTSRRELARRVPALGKAIHPDRSLWIAWPKRSSGVATDVTEDTIREVALPLGLVDNKVCAVDETWSGLRVVWRRELR